MMLMVLVAGGLTANGAAQAAAPDMTQFESPIGCIGPDTLGAICTPGTAMEHPAGVVVSPDGRNVYVGARLSQAVLIFDRDPATGVLTQKPGTAGCISETGSGGACQDGVALNQANRLTVSPDGENVYVGSLLSGAIAIFDRNTTTGELTQKPGTAGCVSDTGTGGLCQDGKALAYPNDVVVSPNGRSVYVAAVQSNAIAVFDRDVVTGELTQKSTASGCWSESGTEGVCQDGKGLTEATSVAVSRDNLTVYVHGAGTMAIFSRSEFTGNLAQKADPIGCINAGAGCGTATGLSTFPGAQVIVSPDDRNVYTVGPVNGQLGVFDRDLATGAIAQNPNGCVPGSATCEGNSFGVAISGDGSTVFVAEGENKVEGSSSTSGGGITIFDRDTSTGVLTPRPGVAPCVGTGIACSPTIGDTSGNYAIATTDTGNNAYVGGSNVVKIFGAKAAAPPDEGDTNKKCLGKKVTILGTAKQDDLSGTNENDVIFAGGGNDQIFGRGGNDLICSGGGNDTISGGNGKDGIKAGGGNDDLGAGAWKRRARRRSWQGR